MAGKPALAGIPARRRYLLRPPLVVRATVKKAFTPPDQALDAVP
jgi:hypothetical protein